MAVRGRSHALAAARAVAAYACRPAECRPATGGGATGIVPPGRRPAAAMRRRSRTRCRRVCVPPAAHPRGSSGAPDRRSGEGSNRPGQTMPSTRASRRDEPGDGYRQASGFRSHSRSKRSAGEPGGGGWSFLGLSGTLAGGGAVAPPESGSPEGGGWRGASSLAGGGGAAVVRGAVSGGTVVSGAVALSVFEALSSSPPHPARAASSTHASAVEARRTRR